MTYLKTLIIACTLCLAGFSLTAQKDVSAEIAAINDRWEASFNKGDAQGIANLYTEDGRLYPPNHAVIAGRANIKEFWGGFVAPGVSVELSTVSAMGKGKMAVEEGLARIYAGDAVVDEAKYIIEWKKVNGTWQIHKDMWSSNNPLPEQ